MVDVYRPVGPKRRPHIRPIKTSHVDLAPTDLASGEARMFHPGYITNYEDTGSGIRVQESFDKAYTFGDVIESVLDTGGSSNINSKYVGYSVNRFNKLVRAGGGLPFYHLAGFDPGDLNKRIVLNKSDTAQPNSWSEVFDVDIDADLGVVSGGFWEHWNGEIFAFQNGNLWIVSQFVEVTGGTINDARIVTVDKNGALVNLKDNDGNNLHDQDLSAAVTNGFDAIEGGLFLKNAFSVRLQAGYFGVERTFQDGGEEIYAVDSAGPKLSDKLPQSSNIGNLFRISMDEKSAQFYINDFNELSRNRNAKQSIFHGFGTKAKFEQVASTEGGVEVSGVGIIAPKDASFYRRPADVNQHYTRSYGREAESGVANTQDIVPILDATRADGSDITSYTQAISVRRNRRVADTIFIDDEQIGGG